jgi:hypothetical protein
MNRRFVVALLVGMFALAPVFAVAQDTGSSDDKMIEMAHTKAEHQALAKQYKEDAAQARSAAKRHEQMSRAYTGGKSGGSQTGANHCKNIAADQEKIAKEYDGLAKLHEEEAKKAKE